MGPKWHPVVVQLFTTLFWESLFHQICPGSSSYDCEVAAIFMTLNFVFQSNLSYNSENIRPSTQYYHPENCIPSRPWYTLSNYLNLKFAVTICRLRCDHESLPFNSAKFIPDKPKIKFFRHLISQTPNVPENSTHW